MNRSFLLAVFLFGSSIVGCSLVEQTKPDPSAMTPGQVLSEEVTEIDNGYLEVARSQVNPPGHWEEVGHFVFVYFKEKQLCQCSATEIAFSPDGRYAVFVNDRNGYLTLFNASTGATIKQTKKYIGTPYSADWDLSRGRAIVHLRKWITDKNDYERTEVIVDLKDGT